MSQSQEASPVLPSSAVEEVAALRRLVKAQEQSIAELQQVIETLMARNQQQAERIEQLEAEVCNQKKLKGRPKISPSRLNAGKGMGEKTGEGKRAGSAKKGKKQNFEVDEERIIEPETVPEGSEFNGYRDYDVQELELKRHNIRFRLAEYVTPEGKTVVGELPKEYHKGHYGPLLLGYILYQYYQCRVSQALLYEQLSEWGIEISVGQLHNILSEHKESFHAEQKQVLQAALEHSGYIHTDDTGARHQGKNGYCTVIGNEWFTYFHSSASKSRLNFLEVLQGGACRYVLNAAAREYLAPLPLAQKYEAQLSFSEQLLAESAQDWQAYLVAQGIVSAKAVQLVTEAALFGGLMSQSINPALRLLSDGAKQFNLLTHGLCWVHAERALRRLQGNTQKQRDNIAEVQDLLWQYYQQLKQYQMEPTAQGKITLELSFDQLFGRCYLHHATLNIVLKGFREHKAQLLLVLDYPQFPLHNNGAETDIREYVLRRKISGGTRSKAGQQARDTLIGLKKTCRKLGISFWQFLLSRLHQDGEVPPLPDILRHKAKAALALSTGI
jgi:hypothetical protein